MRRRLGKPGAFFYVVKKYKEIFLFHPLRLFFITLLLLLTGLLIAWVYVEPVAASVTTDSVNPTPLFSSPPSRNNALPAGWTDPAGDVTLANADIISGSAVISSDLIDFRVQFLAPSYPNTATHNLVWCLDMDQNPTTGDACGEGQLTEADIAFTLDGGLDALETGDFWLSGPLTDVDPCSVGSYNPDTNTIRLLVPLSYFQNDSAFNYLLVSEFGGSAGLNEYAPDAADFSDPNGYFTSQTGELFPFAGQPLCIAWFDSISIFRSSAVSQTALFGITFDDDATYSAFNGTITSLAPPNDYIMPVGCEIKLNEVSISGPAVGIPDRPYVFTATVSPLPLHCLSLIPGHLHRILVKVLPWSHIIGVRPEPKP